MDNETYKIKLFDNLFPKLKFLGYFLYNQAYDIFSLCIVITYHYEYEIL